MLKRSLRALLLGSILTTIALPAVTEKATVWVDVRSSLEHKITHIENDPRISHFDIVPAIEQLYPDRKTVIKLYCRSGGRAGKAEQALRLAGYTNVHNVGSIEEARRLRSLSE